MASLNQEGIAPVTDQESIEVKRNPVEGKVFVGQPRCTDLGSKISVVGFRFYSCRLQCACASCHIELNGLDTGVWLLRRLEEQLDCVKRVCTS